MFCSGGKVFHESWSLNSGCSTCRLISPLTAIGDNVNTFYGIIIYLMKDHPVGAIQRASELLFKVFILGIILAIIALYFIDRYIALAQLFILFVICIYLLLIDRYDKLRGHQHKVSI